MVLECWCRLFYSIHSHARQHDQPCSAQTYCIHTHLRYLPLPSPPPLRVAIAHRLARALSPSTSQRMPQAGPRLQRGVLDDLRSSAVALSEISPHRQDTTLDSPRHVRVPITANDDSSGSSSAIHSLTSASTLSTLEGKLDLSPTTDLIARRGLSKPFFDQWGDDSTAEQQKSPAEMQKNDPLGTQIWKLYHKTKGQLPNSERLENLSWRMMSMNLRRRELERRQE